MIIALAGRRIDAADAQERRFPIDNVDLVRKRVHAVLRDRGATTTVTSAACGADLIAISEARSLGIRRVVILPFAREQFRETSVVDRPGDWGGLYDSNLNEVKSKGDLLILKKEADTEGYLFVNTAILDTATTLAVSDEKGPPIAVVVWDGASRGKSDITEQFGAEARKRGLEVVEVRTLP